MKRVYRLSALSAAACTALAALMLGMAGCSRGGQGPLPIALIGEQTAVQASGVRLSPAARMVRGATVEGLVGFDAEGQIVPALADRWIITDDGESYIFRLRDGTWPGGARITAETAAAALRKALAQIKGTALGLDLAAIEQVRVMADRVIEIDLSTPSPDLLTLLAQPELGLLHARRGTGPMVFRRKDEATILSLIPPEQRGLAPQENFKRRVRDLVIHFLPAASAVQRFNDGDADVVLGGRIDSLPLVSATQLSRGNIRLDPVIGMFGLLVDSESGFLGEAPNREALALAIDRDAMISAFNIGGWQPTTRVVSSGLVDDPGSVGERWVGVAMEQRRALAAERVTRYKATGKGAPVLRIAAPDGPGSRIVLDRLATDFDAIGMIVVRVGENKPADLRLIDATARYSRATWFLNQLACSVHKAACSSAGDALLASARMAKDARERAALLGQAEAEITAANVFIPIARPMRWSLVRSGVTGFAANPWGWHPLPPLALLAR